MNVVEVQNLVSGYESGRPVLKKVSMDAYQGEITAVLGMSGCGKTTLLKHLIRLMYPWEGSLRILDQEITRMEEPEFNVLLKRVGVLFQNGALINSMTIAENVAIPLEQHTHLPRAMIDELVRLKLDLVGLAHTLHMLPAELSGGMRRRAALARALALDPELLFCDEPTAGLDPMTAASLDGLILKMRDELNMSVVVITHVVASILRIADRVIFMDEGRVLFSGSLDEARQSKIVAIREFFENG